MTSWLPASTEDPELFHVVHDDGEWLSQHMALMWWYVLQEMKKTWMRMRLPLRCRQSRQLKAAKRAVGSTVHTAVPKKNQL